MKLLFVWAASVFCATVAVPALYSTQAPPQPCSGVSEAEYEVLSAYITSQFTSDKEEDRVGHRVATIIIGHTTQSDVDDRELLDDNGKQIPWKKLTHFLHKQAPALQEATLDSFRRESAERAAFERSFHVSVAYELVDKAEIDAALNKGGWWTDFYKKYPKSQGFLTLSRVGFSQDGKQALFYARNGCGGKCGTGTYVVMKRADSGWRVLREIVMRVS